LGVTGTGADTAYAFRANNLSDLASSTTARTNLGLGTAATTASTDYATAAQGTKADTALQPATIGTTVQGYDVDTTKNDVANTFTANQIISVTGNTNAALRITQLGTGNALIIEDETNPDSTPFVVDASGNVLVGTTSSFGQGKVCVQSGTGLSLKGTSGNNTGEIEFIRADNSAQSFKITANGADFYIANAAFSKYAQLLSQNFTSWTFASDKRIKNNIEDLSYGLAEVLKIKPRQFNYISDNQHDIGFIAQELQTVIPEAVSGTEIPYEDTDTPQEKASKTMGVSKDALIPVLVKAIQELKAIADTQSQEIATQAQQIKVLQGVA
jgi:hypothetical protein